MRWSDDEIFDGMKSMLGHWHTTHVFVHPHMHTRTPHIRTHTLQIHARIHVRTHTNTHILAYTRAHITTHTSLSLPVLEKSLFWPHLPETPHIHLDINPLLPYACYACMLCNSSGVPGLHHMVRYSTCTCITMEWFSWWNPSGWLHTHYTHGHTPECTNANMCASLLITHMQEKW